MNSFTNYASTARPSDGGAAPPSPVRPLPRLEAGPLNPSAWNEAELTDAIVSVCDEMPSAPMLACWRTLEHCRQSIPRGSPESLRAAMREKLRGVMGSPANVLVSAA
jgi:hypothetical protein